MSADVLRRAAGLLRNPELCNWPPKVATSLADTMDVVARVVQADTGWAVARPGYGELVTVAHAVLDSLGVDDETVLDAQVKAPGT